MRSAYRFREARPIANDEVDNAEVANAMREIVAERAVKRPDGPALDHYAALALLVVPALIVLAIVMAVDRLRRRRRR